MTAVDDFIANLKNYRASADSAPMIGDIDLFIAALQQLAVGGGGGPPTGPAGGDLSGTYPNPQVASSGGVAFGSAAFASTAAFDAAGAAATAQANAEAFAANASNLSSGTVPSAQLSTNQKTQQITIVIDGQGAVITTGIKRDIIIEYACTITGWQIVADQAGAIQIDLWKTTFAGFPPTVANTIINTGAGGVKPNIPATNQSAQSANVNNWTTAIAAGDVIRPNVDSVATIQSVTLVLTVVKT